MVNVIPHMRALAFIATHGLFGVQCVYPCQAVSLMQYNLLGVTGVGIPATLLVCLQEW